MKANLGNENCHKALVAESCSSLIATILPFEHKANASLIFTIISVPVFKIPG